MLAACQTLVDSNCHKQMHVPSVTVGMQVLRTVGVWDKCDIQVDYENHN